MNKQTKEPVSPSPQIPAPTEASPMWVVLLEDLMPLLQQVLGALLANQQKQAQSLDKHGELLAKLEEHLKAQSQPIKDIAFDIRQRIKGTH